MIAERTQSYAPEFTIAAQREHLVPEELEDRASALFVRLNESFHDGRLADLAPFATESLLGARSFRSATRECVASAQFR